MSEHHPTADAAPVTQDSAPSKRLPHVPRLSIAYLLGWTTVTAILLAVLTAFQTRVSGTLHWGVIAGACFAALSGALAYGSLLIAWHGLRRTLWSLEPGEWLVIGAAIWAAGRLISQIVLPRIFDSALHSDQPSRYGPGHLIAWWIILMPAVYMSAVSLPLLAATVVQRRERIWRAFFATLLSMDLVFVVGSVVVLMADLRAGSVEWLKWVFWPWGTIVAMLPAGLVAIVVSDRRRRVTRHWLHWLGVVSTGTVLVWLTVSFGLNLVALRHP